MKLLCKYCGKPGNKTEMIEIESQTYPHPKTFSYHHHACMLAKIRVEQ